MSADPPMLWRLKENARIVSFSDAHSYWPWRLGREATIFDCNLKYSEILKAIRTGNGLSSTIETVPDYGKYHYDGHRTCNFSCSPTETKKLNGLCPKCKKPLIIGVEYRIEELAKEPEGYKSDYSNEFKRLIPLSELISSLLGTLVNSNSVWEIYNRLIKNFDNEFNVLLNVSYKDLCKSIHPKLAELIIDNRNDKISVEPGYDGVYGKLNVEKITNEQKNLTNF
jgi:uncharacterized protein (TIGR00375 family)